MVERAQTLLDGHCELQPTEFINAGVPGYTNYQELVYFKKYGLALHPDLVGVVFCLNDLHKFLHTMVVNDQGELVRGSFSEIGPDAKNSVDSWPLRIARESYFLRWLRDHLGIAQATVNFYTQRGYSFELGIRLTQVQRHW